MAEWYKDWFSSEEYRIVYKHRNDEDAGQLVELILANINVPAGSEILDMACGIGRHSLAFAKKEYKVTAFDLSKPLLEIARQTADKSALKIDFFNADIRMFGIKKEYDLVCNLFTSFGYFEKDEENFGIGIFENARQHLKQGGWFAFDYLNADYIKEHLNPLTAEKYDDGKIIQRRFIEESRVYKEIIIQKNGVCKTYWESVKLYPPKEILLRLQETGFKIMNILGDYNGGVFVPNISPRLIIFARK
jgi:SAM-dependent methyltransferase